MPGAAAISRRDIHLPNESDGFVLASGAMRGRGLMPGERPWLEAAAACEILPVWLEREDPVNVRVVVGGALDEAEQAEWVGRIFGGLRIQDGQLALCGGAAYLIDKEDWAAEYARLLPVPPGDYRATLYSYATAPNGRACLERAGGDEPFGAWFRRTRAAEEWPPWLHNWCVSDPEQDPGHQEKWKRARERPRAQVIDFLLHLEPVASVSVPAPIEDHGFAEAAECRKPHPFPLGLAARDLAGFEEELDDGGDSANVDQAEPTAEVRSRTASFPLQPISGGPVEVPLGKMPRVFRIAWFCHPYTQPEIRLELPVGTKVAPWPEIENVRVVDVGRELRIGFVNTGQTTGALEALTALARHLGGLPNGTLIEMDTARRDVVGSRPAGLHRYRGTVAASQWRLSEAFPPVDAARLREALALAEGAESGRQLQARDEDEAEQIEARLAKHAPYFFAGNPLQRTGEGLSLRRRDPAAMAEVAARAFWLRYADTWTLHDFDLAPE